MNSKHLLLISTLSLLCISCDSGKVIDTYTEVVVVSPQRSMPVDKSASMHLPDGHPVIGDNLSSDMPMNSPEMNELINSSKATSNIGWKTPKNWMEEPGSGMRLVTFKTADTDAIECSIVSLSGPAGGITANINRWLKQIKLPEMSELEIAEFLKTQKIITSQNNQNVQLVDLTQKQKSLPDNSPSAIAGIIKSSTETIFIKMTGTKKAVLKHLDEFKSLCQTVSAHE